MSSRKGIQGFRLFADETEEHEQFINSGCMRPEPDYLKLFLGTNQNV